LAKIQAYAWPGNVRQLENAVERAIAFSTGESIETLELDVAAAPSSPQESPAAGPSGFGTGEGLAAANGSGMAPTLSDIEKAWIFWVLSQHNWHKPTAARILGLDISTLYRKIEKYGLKAGTG
jgi:two-component system response regulator HydG